MFHNKKITTVAIFILVTVALTSTRCGSSKEVIAKKAKENYTKLCADCHGKDITDFEKMSWRHGITEEEIYTSILKGYDNDGMPAFEKGLSKSEIRGLATAYVNALEDKNTVIFKEKNDSPFYTSEGITVKVDTVITGLDVPWGMTQIGVNTFLVTDRNGKLYKVDNGKKTKIGGVPKVRAAGQGGLLDIVTHPKYNENGWLYISYSKPKTENDEEKGTTAIIRCKLENDSLVNVEEIFEAHPYVTTKHHYGCRMVFDKIGYLYFSVGERGRHDEFAQKIENDNGKIHRIFDDGRIPTDNPYYETKDARKSIFTYGNRNPQGIILNPLTNEIWQNEHGPRGGDELNIVKAGANYGWPVISYGINYNGTQLTNKRNLPGMEQPIHYWVPSIGPGGMCFVNSDKYPAWKNNIMVNSMKFKYLNRCVIENGKVKKEEQVLKNVGRIRFVYMGNDGYMYIGIENPGIVLKLLSQ